MNPIYFSSPADFRQWLADNHETAPDVWVGYYKVASGRPSLTWSQAVDQALCFGWIDGIVKSIDDISYRQRFTPRRPGSNWSAINIAKVAALTAQGLMHPAGLRAYEARREANSRVYSYEQRTPEFDAPFAKLLRKNKPAAKFFEAQPPSYRKMAVWWVMSAKREETRLRRLEQLIEFCVQGQRLPQFARPSKAK